MYERKCFLSNSVFKQADSSAVVQNMKIAVVRSDEHLLYLFHVQLIVQEAGFAAKFGIIGIAAELVLDDQLTVSKVLTVRALVLA